MTARDAWIQPKEPPATIEYFREVPLWELGEITEEVTDDDYRTGIYWNLGGLFHDSNCSKG